MSQQPAGVAAWSPPSVEGPLVARGSRADALPSADRQAWERGFAAGREAGISAVRKEHQALTGNLQLQVQSLSEVLDFLTRPIADMNETVEAQLTNLAGSIARAVIRRELKTQPEAIIALVRETVTLLPLAARDIRVHLHPEDAAIVRDRLAQASGERSWTMIEDPVLSRGGCEVRSNDSTVDARVEQRINAAIAAAFGDERSGVGRGQ